MPQCIALCIVAMLTFAACKSTKDVQSNSNAKSTNDTTSQKIVAPKIYRASNTIINDLVHTKLQVSFDWNKKHLYGKATITCKPHFYTTRSLTLDARGMDIKEVSMIGNNTKSKLNFAYLNDTLLIDLDRDYTRNETYTIYVDYIARPDELKNKSTGVAITDDKGLYFVNADGKDKSKPKQLWTQGETESSSVWFPTIDKPNMKTTQEIYITVDSNFVTLSNGALMSQQNNGDGTRTDYWKMSKPHAPYLFMMAVSEFAIVQDKWRNIPVNYYVDKEYEQYAKKIFGATPQMLEFFSTRLGVDYAWEKYSQVIAHDYVSGAMENTSATLHGEFVQTDSRQLLDNDQEDIIAHELFHQWFGDLVTCESWSNTPLNESFATYGEHLWREFKDGRDAGDDVGVGDLRAYLNESGRKQVNLIRFEYEVRDNMFDSHSYAKGGRVLHMLRKYVGDDAFFASLKEYLETNKYQAVEIHNLRLAFEKVTGEDLNWFFNQWFLDKGHPVLDITYNYVDSNHMQQITVKQLQDFSTTPLYKLPVDVDLYINGKAERHRITITKSEETFSVFSKTKPDLINFDAEKMLLCRKTDNHSPEEWQYMYYHAPLLVDRYEPLDQIGKNYKPGTPQAQIVLDALNDKYSGVRIKGIKNSSTFAKKDETKSLIKSKLSELALKDAESDVRAAAIEALAASFTDTSLVPLYNNCLRDSSYTVVKQALNGYVKCDKAGALNAATYLVKQNNKIINRSVANVYAEFGNESHAEFLLKSFTETNGFAKYSLLQKYSEYLKRMPVNIIEKAVPAIQAMAQGKSAWFVKLAATNTLNDISKKLKTKGDELEKEIKTLKADNQNSALVISQALEFDKTQRLQQFIERAIGDIKANETDEQLIKAYKELK